MRRKNLEVCLTPAIFGRFENKEAIVVIIDVLRASSAICTAFSNGAYSIIPVSDLEEARDYKNRGYLVAAERDGYVLDFADFGNSPFNFTRDKVAGKTIVYSTTNGTRIIELASNSYLTVIGTFLNITGITTWLIEQERDIILFCAGWKDKVNLEDSVCAGAIAQRLLNSGQFNTICDSVHMATDLWKQAGADPLEYIEKAAQRSRLREKGLDDCLEYCMTFDLSESIPAVQDGVLKDMGPSWLDSRNR
jgi:2-phosphosulfolactate phosphatase